MKKIVLLVLFIIVPLSVFSVMFVLEDQYRRKTPSTGIFGKKPVIILAGDGRKTARWIRRWAVSLRRRFKSRVRIFGLADLDGVPFFVSNNSVRNSIKKTCPGTKVLCDWDGKVFKRLGFKEGYTVRVYSRKGRILGEVRGGFSRAGLQRVERILRSVR